MKTFNRELWGAFLIGLGALLVLAALYDALRPFLPASPSAAPVRKVRSFLQDRFRLGSWEPGGTDAVQAVLPEPPPRADPPADARR